MQICIEDWWKRPGLTRIGQKSLTLGDETNGSPESATATDKRHTNLTARGKHRHQIVTPLARELSGIPDGHRRTRASQFNLPPRAGATAGRFFASTGYDVRLPAVQCWSP